MPWSLIFVMFPGEWQEKYTCSSNIEKQHNGLYSNGFYSYSDEFCHWGLHDQHLFQPWQLLVGWTEPNPIVHQIHVPHILLPVLISLLHAIRPVREPCQLPHQYPSQRSHGGSNIPGLRRECAGKRKQLLHHRYTRILHCISIDIVAVWTHSCDPLCHCSGACVVLPRCCRPEWGQWVLEKERRQELGPWSCCCQRFRLSHFAQNSMWAVGANSLPNFPGCGR